MAQNHWVPAQVTRVHEDGLNTVVSVIIEDTGEAKDVKVRYSCRMPRSGHGPEGYVLKDGNMWVSKIRSGADDSDECPLEIGETVDANDEFFTWYMIISLTREP